MASETADGLVAACRVAGQFDAGSHLVFLGAVTDVAGGDGDALVYANRRYGRHAETEPSAFADYPQAMPQPRAKHPQPSREARIASTP